MTAVAVATTAVVATPADAYCRSSSKWATSNRDVYMATSSIPSSWASTIQSSGTAWNGVTGSTWNMGVRAYGTNGPPSSGGWVYRASGFAEPGLTQTSGGTITWANTYLNSGYTFNGVMNQANKTADLKTVTVHEFGHWLTLLHPGQCDALTDAERAAVMHPNWTIKRSLGSDDRAGSAAMY